MRDIRHDVGERIRQFRLLRGLSQEALAERSGLHATQVQRIEQGKLNPRLTTLLALAQGLGIPLGHLFADPVESGSQPLKDLDSLLAGRSPAERDLVFELTRTLLNHLPRGEK